MSKAHSACATARALQHSESGRGHSWFVGLWCRWAALKSASAALSVIFVVILFVSFCVVFRLHTFKRYGLLILLALDFHKMRQIERNSHFMTRAGFMFYSSKEVRFFDALNSTLSNPQQKFPRSRILSVRRPLQSLQTLEMASRLLHSVLQSLSIRNSLKTS